MPGRILADRFLYEAFPHLLEGKRSPCEKRVRSRLELKAVVLVPGGAERSAAFEADLKEVGVHIAGAVSCEELVQSVIRLQADVVVAVVPAAEPELFAATTLLDSVRPTPVAVFTEDARVESMELALASGIHAWIVRGYDAERLRPVLQLARARQRRDARLRGDLADLSSRLDERKLVDRAKGILMSARNLPEDEAFRILRDAAMHGKQRVGQVAQRLIDAARNAEAINRAGQLRMLSQRLVKLHLLDALGVEPEGAAALRRASIERLTQNLEALADLLSTATFGDLLDTCTGAWRALKAALAGDAGMPSLVSINEAAERLLEAAERLTAALESASTLDRMQVVNLAGRQRMLSQRFAKLALLAVLLPPAHAAAFEAQRTETSDAFDDALARLRRAPATTIQARKTLDEAATAWTALRKAGAAPGEPENRLRIAQASEELLERFDALTEDYEHSLKVLVG